MEKSLSWEELSAGLSAIDEGNALRYLAPQLDRLPQSGRSWLAGVLGVRPPLSETIEAATPFEDGGFFLRSRVISLSVRPTWQARLFSGGLPSVLVAFGVRGLRLLQGHESILGELLREQAHPALPPRPLGALPYRLDDRIEEARLPSDGDPLRLARLWAEAIGRRPRHLHRVIVSPEEGAEGAETALPARGSWAPQRVQIDAGLWATIHAPSLLPVIEGDAAGGWELKFFTVLRGSSPMPVVTRQRLEIRPDFRLSARQEILATEYLPVPVARGRPLPVGGQDRTAPLSRRGGWC